MSKIYYHPRTIKFLKKIPQKSAEQVYLKIGKLKVLKQWSSLDIKRLVNTQASYRLRVGNIRVIFEQTKQEIYIHEIDFRGNVY